jgi:hypothetical protein
MRFAARSVDRVSIEDGRVSTAFPVSVFQLRTKYSIQALSDRGSNTKPIIKPNFNLSIKSRGRLILQLLQSTKNGNIGPAANGRTVADTTAPTAFSASHHSLGK